MAERVVSNNTDCSASIREAVCINTRKIFDSCKDKDCVDDHWLDEPEVYFLQPETSLLYRDMMVFKGASMNQLKPVRVIMNERQRKFFFALIQEMEP